MALTIAQSCVLAWSLSAQVPVFELAEELRIGSLDEPGYVLVAPFHLVSNDEGRIAVSEPGRGEILVYNSQGEFERRLGGRGDGPGEFRSISGLAWSGDRLWVLDRGARRVTAFGADGEVLETRQLEAPGSRGLRLEGVLADGTVLATAAVMPPRAGEEFLAERELLRLRDADTPPDSLGIVLRRAPVPSRVTVETPRGPVPVDVRSPGMHDRLAVAADGRRFVVVSPSRDETGTVSEAILRSYDAEGELVFSRRVPIEPSPVSTSERDEEHGRMVEALLRAGMAAGAAARLAREAHPLGDHRFGLAAPLVDRDGALWLTLDQPSEMTVFDGQGGSVVRRVRSPEAVDWIMGIDGDHVWARAQDERGVPFIVRFGLRPRQ